MNHWWMNPQMVSIKDALLVLNKFWKMDLINNRCYHLKNTNKYSGESKILQYFGSMLICRLYIM